ncbi:MAG: class I SAM-dependent methyltransferase [Desulfotomaculales bacterium]
MDTKELMRPAFWARAWEEAAKNAPTHRRRVRNDEEMIENWNRRAASFARGTSGAKGARRQEEVLALLRREGALRPGIRVLDIGAGPGNFALPLASVAGEMVAVEPAAGMLRILQERAACAGIKNIICLQRTWQEIDLEKEG